MRVNETQVLLWSVILKSPAQPIRAGTMFAMPTASVTVDLDAQAMKDIISTIDIPDVVDESTITALRQATAHLPDALHTAARNLVQEATTDGILVVRHAASLLLDETIPTPSSWEDILPAAPDLCMLLVATLLGEPVAIKDYQGTRFTHEVMPVPGDEIKELISSSTGPLGFHTEDAFSVTTPDFLGLMCMRNDDNIPTVLSSLEAVDTANPAYDILFDNALTIDPELPDGPPCVKGVLFGSRTHPRLNFDPNYDPTLFYDPTPPPEYANAVELLAQEFADAALVVFLEPGDMCFFDNHHVVHSRPSFTPKYDGADRWLKRTAVERNLTRLAPYLNGRVLG